MMLFPISSNMRGRYLVVPLIFLLALVLYRASRINSTYLNILYQRSIQSEKGEIVDVNFEELLKGPFVLPQNHPQLIQLIQKSLSPPSTKDYNLTSPDIVDPSYTSHGAGQTTEIMNILGEIKDGFFIECGALDGERYSNTLMFERKYGWTGLLVEANPISYVQVMSKNRKVWTLGACLSTNAYPNTVIFKQGRVPDIGKITDLSLNSNSNLKGYAEVQCFPLYSILLALNTTTIDFFSLDVEGNELDVLKTIPWDKVNIKTLSVEFVHILEGKEALIQYMESNGYYTYGTSKRKKVDYIFYRKDIVPKIKP